MQLIMAVKSVLYFIIKRRGFGSYYLNDRLCCTVELFLLLRGKLFAVDDEEIQHLMLNDWNLLLFVKELIWALISSKKFGGDYALKCNEEITVYKQT